MKRLICLIIGLTIQVMAFADAFPRITHKSQNGYFPMVSSGSAADIYIDEEDFNVVEIAAGMLADDMERVTGVKAEVKTARNHKDIPAAPAIIAGTLGRSKLIDRLSSTLEADQIRGKWESFMIVTIYIHVIRLR